MDAILIELGKHAPAVVALVVVVLNYNRSLSSSLDTFKDAMSRANRTNRRIVRQVKALAKDVRELAGQVKEMRAEVTAGRPPDPHQREPPPAPTPPPQLPPRQLPEPFKVQ